MSFVINQIILIELQGSFVGGTCTKTCAETGIESDSLSRLFVL